MAGIVEFRRQTSVEKIEPVVKTKYQIDFSTYSDGPLVGQDNWVSMTGDITVFNGGAGKNSADSSGRVYYNKPLGNDQYCTIIIRENDSYSYLGPMIRATDGGGEWWNNCYYVIANADEIRLIRSLNGSQIDLYSTEDAGVNSGDEMRLEALGTTISFYINNTLIWSGTNSDVSSGFAGIGSYGDSSFNPISTATWEAGEL